MPQVKIDYVVSFSSEHPDHPANNLLSKEISNKRWISSKKGEPSVSIVLQLEKSVQISSVSIGNYHSALIEVLVGRSEAPSEPYEVLLCTCSFMNPSDSRNSTNISNVRTFQTDQLVQNVQCKKWDRVRVVCTQPYNKHVQYGLSFVHFFTSDSAPGTEKMSATSSPKMLGKFRLRDDQGDDVLGFKPGELYAKQKNNLSTDSQIRLAGSPCNLSSSTSGLLVKGTRPSAPAPSKPSSDESLSRKRDKLMYIDDDDEHHEKIDRVIEKDRTEKAKIKESAQKDKPVVSQSKNVKPKDETGSTSKGNTTKEKKVVKNESSDRKRTLTADVEESAKKKKPTMNPIDVVRGDDCLKGVVFVISGYVNPKRGNLRDIAVSLGARYCPDWNPTCTHLICAFPNTPKHEQVKRSGNRGIVVTCEWIEECGKEKAHLPWKWYATDPKERVKRTADDVLASASDTASTPQNDDDGNINETPVREDDMDEDTDDEIEKIIRMQLSSSKPDSKAERIKMAAKKLQISDDESDTELDEHIEKLMDADAAPSNGVKADVYDADTESDEAHQNDESNENAFSKDLLDLFAGIKFYIDPRLNEGPVTKLVRYVKAFMGVVADGWPDKSIDVAITNRRVAGDLLKSKEKRCTVLSPDWVWKCYDTKTLYPFEEYVIN